MQLIPNDVVSTWRRVEVGNRCTGPLRWGSSALYAQPLRGLVFLASGTVCFVIVARLVPTICLWLNLDPLVLPT